ncbi:urease accessory protein UreF [Palleronia aestuarii]|nr:urease accessory UreF family protein [Palleronia aestuarii]
MNDPALILFQLLSPGYPTGAFAYSHGLEQVIVDWEIASADDLRIWIADILAFGAGRSDAILLRVSHAAEPDEVRRIDAIAQAWAGTAERLRETTRQGAAFAGTTARVWQIHLDATSYPVAVGRAARMLDLPIDLTVRLYLQAIAANLVSAAVRRVPLGQTDGQSVLAGVSDLCAEIAASSIGLGLDDLSQSAFAAEIASMRHETLQPRIFQT